MTSNTGVLELSEPGTAQTAPALADSYEEEPTMAQRRCSIPGCDDPVKCRGWCNRHYMRFFRTGDPLGLTGRTVDERFWAKVDKTATCWNWTGYRDKRGYGRFGFGNRLVQPHRFAYEALVGPIPEGLVLDHLCRNPSCVNPGHLDPVTQAENMRRGEIREHHANTLKTHCKRGHPLSGDNIYDLASGARECKTCKREKQRLRYHAQKRAERC